MAILSQFSKCLWCVWPAVVIGIGWFVFYRGVDGKTYYGALPVGKDPLATEGQTEFESTRQRDAEKRRVIYWCAGIIACGYLAVLLWGNFTIKAKASPEITATPSSAATITETWTPIPSLTSPFVPTRSTSTPLTPQASPTYAPTATDRIVYKSGPIQVVTVVVEVERQVPVVITQVVTVVVTWIVIITPTDVFTQTPMPTVTPSTTETQTPTYTSIQTPTPTETQTATETPTPSETLVP
jgi:hypothetical protein